MSKTPYHSPEDVERTFYEILASGDADRLMHVWAEDEETLCVHPTGIRLSGLTAIRDSWQSIFANNKIRVQPEKLPGVFGADRPLPATVVTLCVDAGRQHKLRPGDLLGALTGDAGIDKEAVGKINTFDTRTYFAIDRKVAALALKRLREGKIKGRNFRVRPID